MEPRNPSIVRHLILFLTILAALTIPCPLSHPISDKAPLLLLPSPHFVPLPRAKRMAGSLHPTALLAQAAGKEQEPSLPHGTWPCQGRAPQALPWEGFSQQVVAHPCLEQDNQG